MWVSTWATFPFRSSKAAGEGFKNIFKKSKQNTKTQEKPQKICMKSTVLELS